MILKTVEELAFENGDSWDDLLPHQRKEWKKRWLKDPFSDPTSGYNRKNNTITIRRREPSTIKTPKAIKKARLRSKIPDQIKSGDKSSDAVWCDWHGRWHGCAYNCKFHPIDGSEPFRFTAAEIKHSIKIEKICNKYFFHYYLYLIKRWLTKV